MNDSHTGILISVPQVFNNQLTIIERIRGKKVGRTTNTWYESIYFCSVNEFELCNKSNELNVIFINDLIIKI